jgi:excinuclease ABC subunit A
VVAEGMPEDVARVPGSHTGAALAPVLAAGPHAERIRYDPHAVEVPREGDMPLEAVGQDAQMPWETDGRRWHTSDRVTNKGKPCRWEGAILTWLDEQIHESGVFGDTHWGQRTVVEIAAPRKSQGWFFHAYTGEEWLVWLVFRVGRNTFKSADLQRRLGIRPLNETPGLEVYSNEERIGAINSRGPWQSVVVKAHRLSEIDTPAFRDFLREATQSFQKNLVRLQTRPEELMPWKLNGERWHLSDKGFPPGAKVRWERPLLPRLLELVRAIEPTIEVTWDVRDAVTLRVPGISRMWARWRTKDPEGLDCRFLGKPGHINLAQVEGIGARQGLDTDRKDGDLLQLVFVHDEHVSAARLKGLLGEHLRGFREAFGSDKA